MECDAVRVFQVRFLSNFRSGLLLVLVPLLSAQYPGESAGCWDESFTYQRCCLEDDPICWEQELSKEVCCSAFIETALRSGERGPSHWHFSNLDDAVVPNANTEEELQRCMEANYQVLWNDDKENKESQDLLCENNFVQAAACVARLAGVRVIFDIFLGGGCTASAMARASLMAGRRPGAEIFAFDLPEKLSESLAPGSRLAQGEGTWWNIALLNETQSPQQLQQVLLEPRLASLPRLVLISEHLEAKKSWNSLDVLCQHRQRLDFVIVDASPNVIMEKEWIIIEAICQPKRILLTNLNIPGASSWIWQRLTHLSWRETLAGHYVLDSTPWPHYSELRRLRKWALLESPI
eukprot:s2477_g4.t1